MSARQRLSPYPQFDDSSAHATRGRTALGQHRSDCQAEEKPADMRPPRHASHHRARVAVREAVEKLDRKPEQQINDRWYLDELNEKEDRQDRQNSAARIQDEVSAEH